MRHKALIATLGTTLISTLVQASLIQNGGFESPTLNMNTFSANLNVPGWGTIPGAFNGSVGSIWPSAIEGSQFADIGNAIGPIVSQTFSVASGGMYSLKWSENTGYYGNNTAGNSPYLVTVTGSSGTVFSQTLDAYNYGVWENLTRSLSLATGAYTLSFAPQGVYGGYDSLIDAVSISAPDHTSTAGALGCSVVALGFASRRLRRSLPA